jgi:hypothetical protein
MYSDLPAVEWLLTNLHEAVHRLASPAAIQTSWVEENQVDTDELALELEVFDAIKWRGVLSDEAIQSLEMLDAALDAMSGQEHADLWTADGLRSAPEWARVRQLASVAETLLPPRDATSV